MRDVGGWRLGRAFGAGFRGVVRCGARQSDGVEVAGMAGALSSCHGRRALHGCRVGKEGVVPDIHGALPCSVLGQEPVCLNYRRTVQLTTAWTLTSAGFDSIPVR